LFGHLSWIALGGGILRLIPRPQNFFQQTWYSQTFARKDDSNDKNSNNYSQWVWWTIGGYFVSSWFFNIADFINQWILPMSILEQAQESVVSQLINPEFNDWAASIVGYIAPCITAPWWEEVLYRGFLLPALLLNMKYKWAILWSGIIFAAHHLSPTACIPLAVLGWTWSLLYAKSGNLLTTILIHAMWNSRIFLGSWLGL
jgi:membrane protease YdiL (CAAX protease family)